MVYINKADRLKEIRPNDALILIKSVGLRKKYEQVLIMRYVYDMSCTDTNVSQTGCQTQRDVLESRYTNQLGLQNLQAQQQECCCNTQRAIDNVNAQSFKNTCDITTAIHSEGEATRALINANTMQELRDRLADRDRDLLTANFQLSQQAQSANIINTLQPTPKPAYITCSPYYAYNNGCGCNGYNNL